MDLSLRDRVILANQCRILEQLYPEEAGAYANYREALERGYKYHYDDLPLFDKSEMQPSQSRELVDILDMFRALQRAFGNLGDKSGIEDREIVLQGFDANKPEEHKYLNYARYICLEKEEEKWTESHDGLVNSHGPMLDVYRRMLDEWKRCPDQWKLTKEDILRIVGARTFPQHS
jgi:uncharacterized protein